MRIAVTGSIATDHLMVFPGRFADQLIAGRLDHVSLSFLVDSLDVRHGGVAANIAHGLGQLGLAPVLIGAVGADFEPYRVLLKEQGVDTESVRVSPDLHSARFVCTTDADQNQVATFYAGAMAEARHIGLAPVLARTGGFDLLLVSPNDPEAMLRRTRECQELGIPFAADPSQQLARLTRDQVRALVDGSRMLFTNEYESALLQERSGWTREQILGRTGLWITTLGAAGSRVQQAGRAPVEVPAARARAAVDPTGVGDAYRAGFLAALARGRDPRDAARFGSVTAVLALESVGTQEHRLLPAELAARLTEAYGPAAAEILDGRAEVRP
ncbi:carbohydrate kinase family protein [Streptomyces sp. CMSTAAHL-2]|uniref:carbohydrate kinase family protein n=1 Tax=Streptomyces sp. CMSTAAHL-2 TaxID=2904522 RepID=UPI001E6370C0|nr:carbohydrate kinase family protein [Streptomyces sp. CMSTAAHL-2]MCE3030561.1 carbohydrate kinase family protein [Streptomyces sp. CMSTAAHL-2]